jgi:hypothetical protein
MSEESSMVKVPEKWYELLRIILSTNLRTSLSEHEIRELNSVLDAINGGKTGPSPRCQPEMTGWSDTPIAQCFPPSTIELSVAQMSFRGVQIMMLLPPIKESKFVLDLVAEDKFTAGLSMMDNIRKMFATALSRKLDEFAPRMVDFFGQNNLLQVFYFQKDELKAVASIFGLMISRNFSESDMIKDFWFLIMKWLIFSRFTESLVSLITNMIQFPGGQHLVISDTGLEALQKLLQPITPIPSGTSHGMNISSKKQNLAFIVNMRQFVCDLKQFASAFSGHVRSTSKFDGHIQAIEKSLLDMEHHTTPNSISRNMNLFPESLSNSLGSSESKTDIITIVCGILGQKSKYSKVLNFFQFGPGTRFVEKILETRISYFKKAKEMVDAQNSLTKAQIESQKLQRKLFRQTAKTERLTEELCAPGLDISIRASIGVQAPIDIRNSIGSAHAQVDLRTDLGSGSDCKRSRTQQSSEAQPLKRRVFDLRDELDS